MHPSSMKEKSLLPFSAKSKEEVRFYPEENFSGCISCVSTRKGARLHATHEQYTYIHKDPNHYKAEIRENKGKNNIYHSPSSHRKLNLLKVSIGQLLSSAITIRHPASRNLNATTPSAEIQRRCHV